MIIVCGGIKGGSGKTTVATNLTIMLANASRDVLLVDADDQETSTDFTLLRNQQREGGAGYTSIQLRESAVRSEVLRMKDKYDDIIIDTGGRDTSSQRAALVVADVLLVPFVPKSFDVWTLEKVSEVVSEIRAVNSDLQAYIFLNRAEPQGHDNEEAIEMLKDNEGLEFIDTPLGYRKAFGHAGSQGLSVVELKPANKKAVDEIVTLFRYLFDIKEISESYQVEA